MSLTYRFDKDAPDVGDTMRAKREIRDQNDTLEGGFYKGEKMMIIELRQNNEVVVTHKRSKGKVIVSLFDLEK